MIPKVICFLFGHRFREKVYIPGVYDSDWILVRYLYRESAHRWELKGRCTRCWVKNPYVQWVEKKPA